VLSSSLLPVDVHQFTTTSPPSLGYPLPLHIPPSLLGRPKLSACTTTSTTAHSGPLPTPSTVSTCTLLSPQLYRRSARHQSPSTHWCHCKPNKFDSLLASAFINALSHFPKISQPPKASYITPASGAARRCLDSNPSSSINLRLLSNVTNRQFTAKPLPPKAFKETGTKVTQSTSVFHFLKGNKYTRYDFPCSCYAAIPTTTTGRRPPNDSLFPFKTVLFQTARRSSELSFTL
jgi:hypothetical protein